MGAEVTIGVDEGRYHFSRHFDAKAKSYQKERLIGCNQTSVPPPPEKGATGAPGAAGATGAAGAPAEKGEPGTPEATGAPAAPRR